MTARILVVDDIISNVKLLEAKLRSEYFDVLTANNGKQALELAAEQSPDLILLDVMMPGMDGFEVCERLKSNPQTRHIPIVMITALTDVSDRVRGLEVGADDFLSKPVKDVTLFARVRSLVRLKMLIDELRIRSQTAGMPDIFENAMLEGEDVKGRILLVDENERSAQRVANFLSEAGHHVQVAGSSEEALQSVQQDDLDLIIVAMEISGREGLRLSGQFRSLERTRNVPILLILDEMDLERLAKGLDLGITDYLVRPIDRNELCARAKTQIRRLRYHNHLRDILGKSVSMAFTDPLTGTFNRRYMSEHLENKIHEIGRGGGPVSIMMIDIDHFKQINDTYGHGSGDRILREIVKRIGENVRGVDLLARYGGEEFILIMPETPTDISQTIAERVRSVVSETPFALAEGEKIPVTLSIGIATTNDPRENSEILVKHADQALYEAKNIGRNRVCVSDPQFLSSGVVIARSKTRNKPG